MVPTSKTILRDFPLIRFYVILFVSTFYFGVQLVVAHLTHSLILQLDAYHMLYNIFSLATCIITVKMCRKGENLKSTFGWMRINVIGAVSNVFFLAALCFSMVVESLQTIFHLSHHQKMSDNIWVLIVGVVGLVVHCICFGVLGGYTFHQSNFIGASPQKEDLIINASVQSYVKRGVKDRRRRGLLEIFRDFYGTFLVIFVATIMQVFKDDPPNLLDPLVTIGSVLVLTFLSYSYAKEACHILLLTIPAHIDVDTILKELHDNFPEICDIHEFHVWQLTPAKIISSAHIVLRNADGYLAMQHNVIDFLHSKGISHVTLQPEFVNLFSEKNTSTKRHKCFLPCGEEDCEDKQCCLADSDCDHGHSHGHSHGQNREHSEKVESTEPSSSLDFVGIKQRVQHKEPEEDEIEDLEPELQPMIQQSI